MPILDQFGRPVQKPRVCGFVAPPAPNESGESDHLADAIASAVIYPEEEVSEL